MRAIDFAPQSTLRWLKNSGLQDANGGVTRYFRGDERLANSSEITGYAVSGFLYLQGEHQARHAAAYLIDRVWNKQLRVFPFEIDGGPENAYFFDSGIIARGLLTLWRATSDKRYLRYAERAAWSMAEDFAAPEGYHPILSLPSKRPEAYQPWWSRNPGCFQLKAALAWRELGRDYEAHYQRLLDFSIARRRDLLSVETDRTKLMDRLHAYCYFLEGLLPVGGKHSDLLREGIDEVSQLWREIAPRFLRSDVLAQLLRLRVLCAPFLAFDYRSAEEEAAILGGFALLDGAFAFGSRNGEIVPHRNPVSTFFAVQGLDWYENHLEGQPAPPWHALI